MLKHITKTLIFLSFIFLCAGVKAGDAYLSRSSVKKYMKANTNDTIVVRVQNNSGTNIVTFNLGWSIDNGTNHISSPVNLGAGGVATGGYFVDVIHFTPFNVAQGNHSLKIWIDAVGETNKSNDTMNVNFTAINNYSDKVVLFEEYTSLLNPNCQYANSTMADIISIPGTAVAIFHDNDALATTVGSQYYAGYFSSPPAVTPAGVINMGEGGTYTVNSVSNNWEEEVLWKTGEICPLDLIINPTLNTSTRQLSVDLTANFKYVINGNFYMNVYLLENGISGTQSGVAGTYINNRVVRTLLGGDTGSYGIIPFVPIINTNYTKTYNYTIPSGWALNKLSLVGVVYTKNLNVKEAVNSVTYNYDHSGIESGGALNSPYFNAFPNPVKNELNIDFSEDLGDSEIKITSIDGKLLYSKQLKVNNEDMLKIDISEFPSGIYLIKLFNKNHISVRKIVKN